MAARKTPRALTIQSGCVAGRGKLIPLTPQQHRVLEALVSRPNEVMTYEILIPIATGIDCAANTALNRGTVHTAVKRLRDLLQQGASVPERWRRGEFKTHWRVGYRFVPADVDDSAEVDASDDGGPTEGHDHACGGGDERTSASPTKPIISIGDMPPTGQRLFGRTDLLQQLGDCYEDPQVRIACVVGEGGAGKTALVNQWLFDLQRQGYRGSEFVFARSFHAQGRPASTSAQLIIEEALELLGESPPIRGTEQTKGTRLAHLVAVRRCVIVLDGIEPLLEPPGREGGDIRDSGLRSFLHSLAWQPRGLGLCVLTTRLPFSQVDDRLEGASVRRLPIEPLEGETGVEILRSHGVRGSSEELRAAVQETAGHALSLVMLGYLVRDLCDGRIDRRRELGETTLDHREFAHAERIVDAYDVLYAGRPEGQLLRLLSLFEQPASSDCLDVLYAARVPNLSDRLGAVARTLREVWTVKLKEAGLVIEDSAGNLTAHTIIRSQIAKRLRRDQPEAWTTGQALLYEHLRAPSAPLPVTLREMSPFYQACWHGCEAGLHRRALEEVFLPRIRRGEERYSIRYLGALGPDLAALTTFFDTCWDKPQASLPGNLQAWVLQAAGFCLQASGRLDESMAPLQESARIARDSGAWLIAATALGNLASVNFQRGALQEAILVAGEAVATADLSGHGPTRCSRRAHLARALYLAGKVDETREAYARLIDTMSETQVRWADLWGAVGLWHCDLLLDDRDFGAVVEHVKSLLVRAEGEGAAMLERARGSLLLGHVHMRQGRMEEAGLLFEDAVKRAEDAGYRNEHAEALTARAVYLVEQSKLDAAAQDLSMAGEIVRDGGLILLECDLSLARARLCLAQADPGAAKGCLLAARATIERSGYGRREMELRGLEALL